MIRGSFGGRKWVFLREKLLVWGVLWGIEGEKAGSFMIKIAHSGRISGIELDFLHEETPLSGEDLGTFPPKNPPERKKIGEAGGGCWGKNGNKKGARSDLLRALFRVIIREILCAS